MLKKIMTVAIVGAVSLSCVAVADAFDFPATPINHGPYVPGEGLSSQAAPPPMAEPMAAPMRKKRMSHKMSKKRMAKR